MTARIGPGRRYTPCPGIAGKPCMGTGMTGSFAAPCLACRRWRCACGARKPREVEKCRACLPRVRVTVPKHLRVYAPCVSCGTPKRSASGTLCGDCSRAQRVARRNTNGRTIRFDDTPAWAMAWDYGYGLWPGGVLEIRSPCPSRLDTDCMRVALR